VRHGAGDERNAGLRAEFEPAAGSCGCCGSSTNKLVLEVDGSVNVGTIAACTAAGAQMLVVSSAIFAARQTYEKSLAELHALARTG
jgi:pentose-5-phosphate-3-epimerase